ncbi:MAG TPA: universal stress protein [Saprospiraceae bacterium]|nr:universal stress protein [Saprospiraceae bacterium]
MHIEIYSIKGFTGSALRAKLEHALAARRLPYEVWEITDIKRFIQLRLPAVPAIKVEDKIFIHPEGGNLDETVEKVITHIEGKYAPSVLVPIDFSAESLHALDYAGEVANAFHFGLTLTHIHQSIYDPVSGGACDVLVQQENQMMLEDLANEMREKRIVEGNMLPVDVHIESGETASSLIQLSLHDAHYKMIVMATKAKDTTMRRLFGTVSNRVAQHSAKPVMIIPPDAPVRFPMRWTIGFDEELLMSPSLDQLLTYHDRLHISMQFAHILTSNEPVERALVNELQSQLDKHPNGVAGLGCELLSASETPIDEILFNKVKKDQSDILVLLSHRRSFIESVQHSSVIRHAIQQPPVPVMIMPLQSV